MASTEFIVPRVQLYTGCPKSSTPFIINQRPKAKVPNTQTSSGQIGITVKLRPRPLVENEASKKFQNVGKLQINLSD